MKHNPDRIRPDIAMGPIDPEANSPAFWRWQMRRYALKYRGKIRRWHGAKPEAYLILAILCRNEANRFESGMNSIVHETNQRALAPGVF